MNAAVVVKRDVQRDRSRKVFQLLREAERQAGQIRTLPAMGSKASSLEFSLITMAMAGTLALPMLIWNSALRLNALAALRRAKMGFCICGYDLRNTVDRCPECGRRFIRKSAEPPSQEHRPAA